MSQWKLPVIDSKKQFADEQEYNFVNKDKKKSKDQTGALSMIEDLKYKIEEQKKQIQNRNATIMGLQRNFQSLSLIVKNQKAQSAALKAEIQNLRQNSETGDKRALEFHEKAILLQNENKMLKQELVSLKRIHAECGKISAQCQTYKNKIIQLQATVDKYSQKLDTIGQQKKILQLEYNKLRGEQKLKRQLQERIIDLEEELKKSMDYNNSLADKLKIQEDRLHQAKSGSSNQENRVAELVKKMKEEESRRKSVESECQALKKEIRERHREVEDLKRNADSLDLYSKMRQQQQEKFKQQLKASKIKCQHLTHQILKLTSQLTDLQRDSGRKSETLKVCEAQLQSLRNQCLKSSSLLKEKQAMYSSQFEKLTAYVSELNQKLSTSESTKNQLTSKLDQQLSSKATSQSKLKGLQSQLSNLNQRMLGQQERYAKYFKSIDENEVKGVVITNNAEMERITKGAARLADTMQGSIDQYKGGLEKTKEENLQLKAYITTLEKEINFKSIEINQKGKQIRNYEQQLYTLKQQQRKLSQTISQQRQLSEQQKLRSQKQIECQQQKSSQYKRQLEEYKQEQQKLKSLIAREQEQLATLTKNKEQQIQSLLKQKQHEIEKQRKNNKLLWTDNKKLKDMESRLREEAMGQIEDLQNRKKLEIQRLRAQLEIRYEQNLNLKREEESNSSQLKKILQEKAQQIKTITENHTKTRNQLEFYKNRNKELEGVVTRTEKAFKDQLAALEKDVKANKEVISVLDKKNSEYNLAKQQAERRLKSETEQLAQQLSSLRQKYESQKIEQKVELIKKSLTQFESTIKAIGNTLLCNYCLDPVKECVRLKECGHIYCRKCKSGYQPNCGECKKTSQQVGDKSIDETLAKVGYMGILVSTLKDDMHKLSI